MKVILFQHYNGPDAPEFTDFPTLVPGPDEVLVWL
jgi:NADPH:quinone reductase-like Zn-dependent oxidoreductase